MISEVVATENYDWTRVIYSKYLVNGANNGIQRCEY